MSELQWETIIGASAVVSALCAIIAALICIFLFRRSKSADYLGEQMRNGDENVRTHIESKVDHIRNAVNRIESNQTRRESQIDELNKAMARIEERQRSEERHIGEQLRLLQRTLTTASRNLP